MSKMRVCHFDSYKRCNDHSTKKPERQRRVNYEFDVIHSSPVADALGSLKCSIEYSNYPKTLRSRVL